MCLRLHARSPHGPIYTNLTTQTNRHRTRQAFKNQTKQNKTNKPKQHGAMPAEGGVEGR